jgi:hypothetical protein
MFFEKSSFFIEVQEIFQTINLDPITVIVGILFLLSFFSILYYLFVIAPLVISSKKWPHVTGKIINNDLKSRGTKNIDEAYTIKYSVELEYSYQINGKNYSSRKIRLFEKDHPISKAFNLGFLDKYPKGANVKVFYNPKKPSVAVLETGGITRLIVIIILLMLSLGALTALLMNKIRPVTVVSFYG